MKDETKEINITFPGQILDYIDTKEHLLELFNYITNLQEENEHLRTQLNTLKNTVIEVNKECNRLFNHLTKKDLDYKSRNEKAIEDIDLVIELIKQQPTEDDTWILNRLSGFKYLLQGEDKDDN